MGAKGLVFLIMCFSSYLCIPPAASLPSVHLQENMVEKGKSGHSSTSNGITHHSNFGASGGRGGGTGGRPAGDGENAGSNSNVPAGTSVVPLYAAAGAANNHHGNHHRGGTCSRNLIPLPTLCIAILASLVMSFI